MGKVQPFLKNVSFTSAILSLVRPWYGNYGELRELVPLKYLAPVHFLGTNLSLRTGLISVTTVLSLTRSLAAVVSGTGNLTEGNDLGYNSSNELASSF